MILKSEHSINAWYVHLACTILFVKNLFDRTHLIFGCSQKHYCPSSSPYYFHVLHKRIFYQNLDKLLLTLKDVPDEQRRASFHCVLVYLRHAEDPTPIVCHGSWQGVLTHEAAGSGGFGYDPIFFVPELGKTAAELTREEKNAQSHRGQALRLLLDALRNA